MLISRLHLRDRGYDNIEVINGFLAINEFCRRRKKRAGSLVAAHDDLLYIRYLFSLFDRGPA